MCRDLLVRLGVVGFFTLLLCAEGTVVAQKEEKPKKAKVTGTVEFKGEAQFEADTIATVKLLDVSLADAPAKTLGEQVIKNLKKFPIAFEIEYDPALIKQGLSYAVQVRIETKGRLDYINDTRIEVLSNNKPATDVKAPVIRVKR